jgi:predicted MPP superfamily phosphohydrolase
MVVILILCIVIVIFLACLLQGVLITNRFSVVSEQIEIKNMPAEFVGKRILHITDLHNSRFGDGNIRLAERVVELKPDYIFVSGDCFDRFSKRGDAITDFLKKLGGKYPVFYSLGNHDVIVRRTMPQRYDEFYHTLCNLGVTVLDNGRTTLMENDKKIYVYGVSAIRNEDGPVTLTAEVIEQKVGKCPDDAPVFLICHEGHLFDEFARWGADISFSGHLHGGIVRVPVLGGLFGEFGKLFPKYDKGVYEKDGRFMNLSSGLGYSKFRFRFLNTPEMSIITLK